MELGPLTYLHPKEGDAGEKVHSGFEVLESLWAAVFSLPQSFQEGWGARHGEGEVGFGQGGGVMAGAVGGRAAMPSPCLHRPPRLGGGSE